MVAVTLDLSTFLLYHGAAIRLVIMMPDGRNRLLVGDAFSKQNGNG